MGMRIAPVEIEDTRYKQPAKVKAGELGGKTRVGHPSESERNRIAQLSVIVR